MQHSALRRRTTPAVMRHRAEAAKSSASPRPPAPPTAQTVTGLSEPFFCFSAASGRPLCRFCRRVAAITVGTATATAQQAQRNNPFGSRPSRCLRCEQPRPKTTPRRPSIAKQTRSAAGKKGASDGNTPTFSRLSATFFEQVPVHSPMRPGNAHDQSAPQRLCGRKHHPPSRFLPSDLHLCPFLPIFAPIHVRKTSHPPSSSGLGLDSSPRPAAAIGGENLSLPRQRGAN